MSETNENKTKTSKLKTLLITGAAGNIAMHMRRELAGKYALRLSDRKTMRDLSPGETFVKGDIANMNDMLRVTKGVDAIFHLGAWSVEGDWDTILSANIEGTYNVYEAARRNGVKRILFATSNHAVGFYRRDETIDHLVYPRPDSRYGVSKAFGEALGSLYAEKYGMEMFMMRIGNLAPAPIDKRRLSIWLSPRDLAQLVQIGVDHPDIKFEVVYGVSGNKRSWYDNSNAKRLGYKPQDDSEPYANDLIAKHQDDVDPTVEVYQGGTFVSVNMDKTTMAPPRAKQPARRATATKRPTKKAAPTRAAKPAKKAAKAKAPTSKAKSPTSKAAPKKAATTKARGSKPAARKSKKSR